MGGLSVKEWPKIAGVAAFLLGFCFARVEAVPVPGVTLLWQHDSGPFSYNVYEKTNLAAPPEDWILKTNVPDLSVHLQTQPGEHFFTVTCVDTNTGLESSFALP